MTDLQTLWSEAFNECIGQEQEKNGSNPVDWRASGRASKAWPDKENGDWWQANGPDMLATFEQVWKLSGWQVWETPVGDPALEIELNVNYGAIRVKAFVDMIAITAEGELAVVDFKTGASTPTSSMQLGLYACSFEALFGIRPSVGFYYDARKGQMIRADGLDRWTYDLFTLWFQQFNDAVDREVFLPNVGMMCKSCSVFDYCYTVGGKLAHTADPLHLIANPKE